MKKPKPKKLTTKWLKRHGFTNALWRLEERSKAARKARTKATGEQAS